MVSELVERYGEKIKATYMANLAFFKLKIPALFDAVMKGDAGVAITAEISEDGLLNFELDGHPLPLTTLLTQSKTAMEVFESGNRPVIEVRNRASLPERAETSLEITDPYIRDYYFSHLDFKARFAIDFDFSERCGRSRAIDFPNFGKRSIPILIVFGSGYGSHLIELLDRYIVRHLIVVDNDPAITRLSLGFTDYLAIYNNHLVRNGTKFTMLCSMDPVTLARDINHAIQVYWPPFFIHGIALFHNLRNIPLCEEVEKGLAEHLWLNYRGWGFFDDELMSIYHSLANFHARRPLFLGGQAVDENAVAFVVANGPSVDALSDLLRAHQGKAVIVSCGTALSAMYRLGIVPDFHIEIERPYTTVENLRYGVPAEFLAKVRLVGPTVLHPEAFDGVAEGLVFLKAGDTSGTTCPARYPRVSTFPTVSNSAVAWLLPLGFKRIYLVGTDLGARDAKRHHSSHSVYFNHGDLPESYTGFIKQASTDSEKMTMEADANFGGKVVTSDIFTLSRQAMEKELAAKSDDVKVFNLSDGVLIKGAEPLKPEDFKFPADHAAKQDTVARIRQNFVVPDDFTTAECHASIVKDVAGMVAELKEIAALEVSDKMTLVEKISMFHIAMSNALLNHPTAYWALRGSLLHQQRRIYDYMTYISDEKSAVEFAATAHAAVSKFMDDALASVRGADVSSGKVPLVHAQGEKPAIVPQNAVPAKPAQGSTEPVPGRKARKKGRGKG